MQSAFKVHRPPGMRPPRATKQIGPEYILRPRAVAVAVAGPARATVAVPKECVIQHAGYMAAVRKLACYRCGAVGFTQFCHADEGKGLGIKSDCRLGWPGCGPRMREAGCHWIVGTSGGMSRAERREFERAASAATRATIRDMGLWPATLPAWAGVHAGAGLLAMTRHRELDQGNTETQAEKVARWTKAWRKTISVAITNGLWPHDIQLPKGWTP